jgi:CarD family transcriptional regulator
VQYKEKFEVGSWVVYPAHGVGKLDGIETFSVGEEELDFFVISFGRNGLVVRLPIKKAINSGLRAVFSKDDLDEALKVLAKKSRKKKVMWNKRAQEYETKINSGDPIAIVEVIRDLHKSKTDPSQSFSERQMYQNALERFSKEMSVVESIDEEEALRRIEKILQAA